MKNCVACIMCFVVMSLSYQARAIEFTVGTSSYYPPFVMKSAQGSLYGFDISLVNYICQKLNVKCQYRPMYFKQILSSVNNNEVDMGISAIVMTPARRMLTLFTTPYLVAYGGYLVKGKSTLNPDDLNALNNKRLGAQEGSVYLSFIKNLKLKNATIIQAKNKVSQIDDLMQGKVDITLMDYPSAAWWAKNSHELAKVVGKPYKIGQGRGIAVAPKNKKYIKNINEAIMAWEADGTFKKLYNMYFSMPGAYTFNELPPEVIKLFEKAKAVEKHAALNSQR